MATRYQQQPVPQQQTTNPMNSYGKRGVPAGVGQRLPQGMLYPGNAVPVGARFGDEIEETGGLGDQIDTLSVRDVATVRYVRHHEWLELVVGNAIDTNKIIPSKVIPESQSQLWTFELESLKKKLKTTQEEVETLELQKKNGWCLDVNKRNKELGEFFRQGTAQLRQQFGTLSANDLETDMINELENKFQLRIIDRDQLRRVGIDLGLEKDKLSTETSILSQEKAKETSDSEQMQGVEQTSLSKTVIEDQPMNEIDTKASPRSSQPPYADADNAKLDAMADQNTANPNGVDLEMADDNDLIPDPNQTNLEDMFLDRNSPALSGDGLDDVLSLTPHN